MDEDATAIGMPAAFHREDKPDRVFERRDLSRFDERDEVFLLDRRVERGPAVGTGHAEVLWRGERCGRPAMTLLVQGLGERSGE